MTEVDATHVYVVASSDGAVKIGVSRKPKRRLSSLQASMPHRVRLLFSTRPKTKTAFQVEREAMNLLSNWHKSGEWFSCKSTVAVAAVKAAAEDCAYHRRFIELVADYERAQDRIDSLMKAGAETIEASAAATVIGKELWIGYRDLAKDFVATVWLARLRA